MRVVVAPGTVVDMTEANAAVKPAAALAASAGAQFAAETAPSGAFVRQANRFTDRITRGPGARRPSLGATGSSSASPAPGRTAR